MFFHVLILSLRSPILLAQRLVHHRDTYFLNLRTISFTFLSFGTSLYSKIRSTVCSHCKNSSGSSFPQNSGMLTLKSLELEVGRHSLIGTLLCSASPSNSECWLLASLKSSWFYLDGLSKTRCFNFMALLSCLHKYSFYCLSS